MKYSEKLIHKGILEAATRNKRALNSIQSLSETYHSQFNKLAADTAAIQNDKSRTSGEKAPLFNKALNKLEASLGTTTNKMLEQLNLAQEEYSSKKEAFMNSGDRLTRIHLANYLRDNKSDLTDIIFEDERFLQASNEFPAKYFGIDAKAMKELQNSAVHRLNPEIGKLNSDIEISAQHTEFLIKQADKLKSEIQSLVDNKALSTRVDESTI